MLTKIVQDCAATFGIDLERAAKLVNHIDLCKLQGLTGGEAASKFADYLGFHRIPDDETSHNFFAERWADHKVWMKISDIMKSYLNNATPIFTQSRLEPQYETRPFYEQGLTKVKLGVHRNPEDGSPVRKAKPLSESYSNFIIHEFLPEAFFLEVHKNRVHEILTNGLRATNEADPYRLYAGVEHARAALGRDLLSKGFQATREALVNYTLLELQVDKMQMNNDVFYTKTLSGHKGQGSNFGYFYIGGVPSSGIKISDDDITE